MIDSRKAKTKVITRATQKKGKKHLRAEENLNNQTAKSDEKCGRPSLVSM